MRSVTVGTRIKNALGFLLRWGTVAYSSAYLIIKYVVRKLRGRADYGNYMALRPLRGGFRRRRGFGFFRRRGHAGRLEPELHDLIATDDLLHQRLIEAL